MKPDRDDLPLGSKLFLPTEPLAASRRLARQYECDLAVPNDSGVGNILMYTRVVEDLAFRIGRPLHLLTAPLVPTVGTAQDEEPFPIWRNHPGIGRLVNADEIDRSIMPLVNREKDNLCQFNHMIENLSYLYGIRPRQLRPSLYLDRAERHWAFEELRSLRRPIICVHPHGTSSPAQGHRWYEEEWNGILRELGDEVTPIEVGLFDRERKNLSTWKRTTKLREMFALVWASDMFVGFDSCVAHVATAFERPALVLWDPFRKLAIEEQWQTGFSPAALSRWAYPQNRNVMLLGDRGNTIRQLVISWIRTICASLRC